jgi:hypothetical protein
MNVKIRPETERIHLYYTTKNKIDFQNKGQKLWISIL